MTHPTLKDIFSLSAEVISIASERGVTLGTAESCTGGLIGAAITSTSGSSAVFKGGIIAYDNQVKISHLNVDAMLIENYGAVSEGVAKAMAQGLISALDVDFAVSVTGVAGPGGGSEEKPIGTVWIGLATREEVTATRHNFGDTGRNKVRDVTCFEALKALKKSIN